MKPNERSCVGHTAEECVDASQSLHSDAQRQPPQCPGEVAGKTAADGGGPGAHAVAPRLSGQRARETGRDGYGPGAHAIPGPGIADEAPRFPWDETWATLRNGSGRDGYGPGAHAIPRPAGTGGRPGPGTGVRRRAPPPGEAEGGVAVYEGFLPPTRRERREARLRRRVEEMRRSAITLDDSAVRTVRDPEEVARDDGGSSEEVALDGRVGWGLLLVILPSAGALIYALVCSAVAFGPPSGPCDGSNAAVAGNVADRYKRAKSIVSEITPPDNLDDPSSPQNKALRWIACQDEISLRLIDGRDPATGILPTQTNGFRRGGDSGEAQVLRRYALAAFFFATSDQGPWSDSWNFLTPDVHECSWHKNKTRWNFPYKEFDPAGLVCGYSDHTFPIVLDDAEGRIGRLDLNFRIPNNLSGTIPPEFGYLQDITALSFEDQKGLQGSLPTTIGKMSGLQAFSILFMGPKLGGTIPSALFTLPSMKYITFKFNEGIWTLPSSIVAGSQSRLTALRVKSSGLSGTMSPIISELTNLKELDFEGNSLKGSIPASFGSTLPSLEHLNLRDNHLSGTLPRSLGRLHNLTAMAFGKNDFQGPIPSSLGNLRKLRMLDLGHNKLEGPVPDSFSRLLSLEHVSLQNNRALHGSISAFEPLNNLTSLLLYENSFSSTIPAGLFSGTSGVNILGDFGHNNFTGKIPKAFSQKASNMTYLAIMKNNFDDQAVDDTICDGVQVLFADCGSCNCCDHCCVPDSTQNSGHLFNEGETPQPFCDFDLDFGRVAGLECGIWWDKCHQVSYDPLPLD